MSLKIFSEDLLLKIIGIIKDDKIRCAIVLTCKEFRDICFKFGWLRTIHFKSGDNLFNFIKFYSRRNNFLERIKISNMIESDMSVLDLIEPWPKEIEFNGCYMGFINDFNIPISSTERLVIRDLHRHRGIAVKIKWESFPKLRILDIYAPDINFEGLELCKNLEIVRIDLDRIKFLPIFFTQLLNLQVIATSCISFQPMHFLSKKLKICMIPKTYIFSSESLFVPDSHLRLNTPMNIQCLDI
jgi:hypothetical protein